MDKSSSKSDAVVSILEDIRDELREIKRALKTYPIDGPRTGACQLTKVIWDIDVGKLFPVHYDEDWEISD